MQIKGLRLLSARTTHKHTLIHIRECFPTNGISLLSLSHKISHLRVHPEKIKSSLQALKKILQEWLLCFHGTEACGMDKTRKFLSLLTGFGETLRTHSTVMGVTSKFPEKYHSSRTDFPPPPLFSMSKKLLEG